MKHIFLFLVILMIYSCTNNKDFHNDDTRTASNDSLNTMTNDTSSKLYVKTYNIVGSGDNQVEKDSLSVVSDKYFEVNLCSTENSGYVATYTIVEPSSIEDYKMVYFNIVNEKGEVVYFESSTDFLNFMDKRSYEMKDQTKGKYSTSYTFVKK